MCRRSRIVEDALDIRCEVATDATSPRCTERSRRRTIRRTGTLLTESSAYWSRSALKIIRLFIIFIINYTSNLDYGIMDLIEFNNRFFLSFTGNHFDLIGLL